MVSLSEGFNEVSVSLSRQVQHEAHCRAVGVLQHLLLPAEQVPDRAPCEVRVVSLVESQECVRVGKVKFLPESIIPVNEFSSLGEDILPETISSVSNVLANMFSNLDPRKIISTQLNRFKVSLSFQEC